ncbi:MAG: copper-binding protein [Betaproteobacteria bacterium]|nr:copper-binding protein [Betaproteobacteria bacterium]MBK7745409.1 copper-binding protein [Betaproteobacteria bacterium]MBK9677088.1 copper-binding protein [Betaproteobacteria bacterium]
MVKSSRATLLAIAAAPQVDGEVRSVDVNSKTVTSKHGDIPNAGMGPTTMSFAAWDAAALAQPKPGDKVKFTAEKVGDQTVVTSNAPAM